MQTCDMPHPEEFRRHAAQLVDWIAEFLARPERYPVLARVQPGRRAAQLPAAPPARGEPLAAILADFERVIVPGITHWNHPGFFAYFAISGSRPGILGELLAAALNVNAMLWQTSPGGDGAGAGRRSTGCASCSGCRPAWFGRHQRHGVHLDAAARWPRRARPAGARRPRSAGWPAAPTCRRSASTLGAGALVGRQGGDRARLRPRERA